MLAKRLQAQDRLLVHPRSFHEESFNAQAVCARRPEHHDQHPRFAFCKLRFRHLGQSKDPPHVFVGARVEVILIALIVLPSLAAEAFSSTAINAGSSSIRSRKGGMSRVRLLSR